MIARVQQLQQHREHLQQSKTLASIIFGWQLAGNNFADNMVLSLQTHAGPMTGRLVRHEKNKAQKTDVELEQLALRGVARGDIAQRRQRVRRRLSALVAAAADQRHQRRDRARRQQGLGGVGRYTSCYATLSETAG